MLMTAVLQWGFASATQKAPLWSHHRNSSFWVKCSFDFLLKHFSNSSCPKFSFLRGSWVMRNFAFFHHNEVFFSGKKANSKGELSGEGLVMGHSGTPLPKCSQALPIHSAWCKSQLCSRSCQNYFTPFKTEHLLGHKEWPDHVGIKILTQRFGALHQFICSDAMRAFLSQVVLCWVCDDFQISQDRILKSFCFCHRVKLGGKKVVFFKILFSSN